MPILQPSNLAPLLPLLAYTQRLRLDQFLRRTRGCSTLVLAGDINAPASPSVA